MQRRDRVTILRCVLLGSPETLELTQTLALYGGFSAQLLKALGCLFDFCHAIADGNRRRERWRVGGLAGTCLITRSADEESSFFRVARGD